MGPHLAFLYAYSKINRRPPAEADMLFEVTPVHRMIKVLESEGWIRRTPGTARSIKLPSTLPTCQCSDEQAQSVISPVVGY